MLKVEGSAGAVFGTRTADESPMGVPSAGGVAFLPLAGVAAAGASASKDSSGCSFFLVGLRLAIDGKDLISRGGAETRRGLEIVGDALDSVLEERSTKID